jgi:hypothetical protein
MDQLFHTALALDMHGIEGFAAASTYRLTALTAL